MRTFSRLTLLVLLVTVRLAFGQSPQPAAVPWRTIAPGVEHAHLARHIALESKLEGLFNINVLRVDPAQARLDVVRAHDQAIGLEGVTSLARRHDAIAAINGGYFRTTGTFAGDSTGTLQIDGRVLSEPDRGRASVGLIRSGRTTRLLFGHVVWTASIDAGGRTRAVDGINRARADNELLIFTPEFSRTTLTTPGGLEVVVRAGQVADVRDGAGSAPIPHDGFVVSASGTARTWALDAFRAGTRVSTAFTLKSPDESPSNPWRDAEDILGAGPKLVTAGRVDVTDAREKMLPTFATDRHPRTAIGALADGRVLLVVVDGRQPALSIGMTLDELARLLIELGAVEAINLDGGGSSAMVLQGKIVNSPSDAAGERPVSDAIIVRPVR